MPLIPITNHQDPSKSSLCNPHQDVSQSTPEAPLEQTRGELSYLRARNFFQKAETFSLVFRSASPGPSISGSTLFKVDPKCFLSSSRFITLRSPTSSTLDGLSGALVLNFNPPRVDEGVEMTLDMRNSQLEGICTTTIATRPHVSSEFPCTTANYCQFPIKPPLSLYVGGPASTRFTANSVTFYKTNTPK